MEKILSVALTLVLITSVLFTGCGTVTGSGNLATKTFDFTHFTKVETEKGFQLELTGSSTFSVEVTADDNVLEHIKVDNSGETLKVSLQWNRSYRSVTLRAKITMPDLHGIKLATGSRANISGFSSSNDFTAVVSNGSELTGSIEAGNVDISLSEGSDATLEGSCDNLVARSSQGSQVEMESFHADNADISIGQGGSATIHISGTLDVDLSSGSKVIYTSEPTMGDINITGGSEVRKK